MGEMHRMFMNAQHVHKCTEKSNRVNLKIGLSLKKNAEPEKN